jgi:flagellar basal body-associated protein FliL
VAKVESDQYEELSQKVKQVNDSLSLIIIVLMVGFLLLLVTVVMEVVHTLAEDTAQRQELTHQVQLLNDRLKQ